MPGKKGALKTFSQASPIVVELSSIPIIWHHHSTSCSNSDGHIYDCKMAKSKIGTKYGIKDAIFATFPK